MRFIIIVSTCILAVMSQEACISGKCSRQNTCCVRSGDDRSCQELGKGGEACTENYTDYKSSSPFTIYRNNCPCADGFLCLPTSTSSPSKSCVEEKDSCDASEGNGCSEDSCCAYSTIPGNNLQQCKPLGEEGDECEDDNIDAIETQNIANYCPCREGLKCIMDPETGKKSCGTPPATTTTTTEAPTEATTTTTQAPSVTDPSNQEMPSICTLDFQCPAENPCCTGPIGSKTCKPLRHEGDDCFDCLTDNIGIRLCKCPCADGLSCRINYKPTIPSFTCQAD